MSLVILTFWVAWFCVGMGVISWVFPDGLRGAAHYVLPARDAGISSAVWSAVMTPVMIVAVALWPFLVFDLVRGTERRRKADDLK